MNENNLIIGECERAGHPISAPVEEYENADNIQEGTIRWLHRGSCFVLQQWREYWENGARYRRWVDVSVSTKE